MNKVFVTLTEYLSTRKHAQGCVENCRATERSFLNHSFVLLGIAHGQTVWTEGTTRASPIGAHTLGPLEPAWTMPLGPSELYALSSDVWCQQRKRQMFIPWMGQNKTEGRVIIVLTRTLLIRAKNSTDPALPLKKKGVARRAPAVLGSAFLTSLQA